MVKEAEPELLAAAELVRAVRAGDDGAYRRLYERYNDRLLAGLRMSLPPEIADDAAQDAWLKAYQRLADLDRPEAFFSWLATIARNCGRSVLREPTRRAVYLDESDESQLEAVDDPYDIAELNERRRAASTALKQLPDRQREVLRLRWIEGKSYCAIAERLGQSLSAVETLLYRARSNFHRNFDSVLSGVQASDNLACYKMRAHLRGLSAGTLSDRRRVRVLTHLDLCSRCRVVQDKMGASWHGFLPPLLLPGFSLGTTIAGLAKRLSAGLAKAGGTVAATSATAVGSAVAVVGAGAVITVVGVAAVTNDSSAGGITAETALEAASDRADVAATSSSAGADTIRVDRRGVSIDLMTISPVPGRVLHGAGEDVAAAQGSEPASPPPETSVASPSPDDAVEPDGPGTSDETVTSEDAADDSAELVGELPHGDLSSEVSTDEVSDTADEVVSEVEDAADDLTDAVDEQVSAIEDVVDEVEGVTDTTPDPGEGPEDDGGGLLDGPDLPLP